jgi:hypothetical protein
LVYYFFKYKIDKGHKIFKKDYELALFIWLVKLFYEKDWSNLDEKGNIIFLNRNLNYDFLYLKIIEK